MRRVLVVVCAVAGCGPHARTADVATVIPVENVHDASVPAAVSAVRARGDVVVSFFGRDGGGLWGPWGEPATDAAAAIRPCYVDILRSEPALVGWIRVEVPSFPGYPAARLVDSSELPAVLVDCVVATVRGLQAPPGLDAPPRVAYVSLR